MNTHRRTLFGVACLAVLLPAGAVAQSTETIILNDGDPVTTHGVPFRYDVDVEGRPLGVLDPGYDDPAEKPRLIVQNQGKPPSPFYFPTHTMDLPPETAIAIHMLQYCFWSDNVPDGVVVGAITIEYQSGASQMVDLVLGEGGNTAEWAYDRPELQADLLHEKIDSALSWDATVLSAGTYRGHSFYLSIATLSEPLASIRLDLYPDAYTNQWPFGYSPGSWFGIGIQAITLEVPGQGGDPIADAGDDTQIASDAQATTEIWGAAADPDGDPLQYRWLEGSVGLLDWTVVGQNGEAILDLGQVPWFSLGDHTLTLEVSDGQVTVSDDMILTIVNSPPEPQPAPGNPTFESGIDPIIVIADVSDFDGDLVHYQWLKDGGLLAEGDVQTLPRGDVVPVPNLELPAGDPRFPLGDHTVELRVSDGVNDPVSAFVTVSVVDTLPPVLDPIPSTTMLWPPNQELHTVTIDTQAYDPGGGPIVLGVTIESSEPPQVDPDGNPIPNYYIDSVDNETGIIMLRLLADRSGSGDGQTFTIIITATDVAGNSASATVEISAPHDKRKR